MPPYCFSRYNERPPRPRSLTSAVQDDVRCVRVLVVLPRGQAGAVAVDHAQSADGAEVVDVDVADVAFDRDDARLAVGTVGELVARCQEWSDLGFLSHFHRHMFLSAGRKGDDNLQVS